MQPGRATPAANPKKNLQIRGSLAASDGPAVVQRLLKAVAQALRSPRRREAQNYPAIPSASPISIFSAASRSTILIYGSFRLEQTRVDIDSLSVKRHDLAPTHAACSSNIRRLRVPVHLVAHRCLNAGERTRQLHRYSKTSPLKTRPVHPPVPHVQCKSRTSPVAGSRIAN